MGAMEHARHAPTCAEARTPITVREPDAPHAGICTDAGFGVSFAPFAAVPHFSRAVCCARQSPGDRMALERVPTGKDVPNEINVIIEIPKDAEPVKYEVDKASGAIFVDRVLSTPMRYPCNYGYVPQTLGGDGDPLDVLVILPLPLVPGSVIRCVPVGVLRMTDEAGSDEKLVAVPVRKVFDGYSHITDIDQVSRHWLERIGHFFEHYKDLEKGKWVKLEGWASAVEAKNEILAGMRRYAESEA
jgi:inorganic pyrophosphatase